MAKPQRINKKNNPIRWRWRSLKGWFYNKWMRWRGYTPTTFNFYDNNYNYEKRKEVDKALVMQEKQPAHEVVGYMADKDVETPWYHHGSQKAALNKGKQKALNSLRGEGDASLIRRTLPRE